VTGGRGRRTSCPYLQNRLIDAEQFRSVEAAKPVGIPPSENERSRTPGLTRVASRNFQQTLEGGPFLVIHCHVVSPMTG